MKRVWPLLLGAFTLAILIPTVAAEPLRSTLQPGDQSVSIGTISVPVNAEENRHVLSFYSERPLTVEIINQTEYGKYALGLPYQPVQVWTNTTEFSELYETDANATLNIPYEQVEVLAPQLPRNAKIVFYCA